MAFTTKISNAFKYVQRFLVFITSLNRFVENWNNQFKPLQCGWVCVCWNWKKQKHHWNVTTVGQISYSLNCNNVSIKRINILGAKQKNKFVLILMGWLLVKKIAHTKYWTQLLFTFFSNGCVCFTSLWHACVLVIHSIGLPVFKSNIRFTIALPK